MAPFLDNFLNQRPLSLKISLVLEDRCCTACIGTVTEFANHLQPTAPESTFSKNSLHAFWFSRECWVIRRVYHGLNNFLSIFHEPAVSHKSLFTPWPEIHSGYTK